MTRIAALWLATMALLLATGAAWADTCETFPGSGVFTDQGCDKPYDNGARQNPAPATQSDPGLRERLRKALSEGAPGGARSANGPTAEQLDQRVSDARSRIDAALADPAAPDARARYDAAMKDLHAAYADAATAFPDKADLFRRLESEDAANASQRAEAAGLNAPAAATASAAAPAGPDNVTAVGGTVYVCDGAIAGANNVACREISADGTQCTGVTLADGGVGWRDSIATPCRDGDMAQRNAFLAADKDAAAAAREAPPGFAMDPAGTEAEIERLTAAPPPARAVDPAEKSDWDEAMADDDAPPSIEDARAATPLDPSSMQASGNGDSDSGLDDAIDALNTMSSLLGAVSGLAGARSAPSLPSGPAPTFRAPPPPQFHAPPPPSYGGHCPNPPSCTTTAQ